MSSQNTVPNYYTMIPKRLLLGSGFKKYPNFNKVQITLPFRGVICGSSGSFKTNTLLHIIRSIASFDKIILLCKLPDEPLYSYLIEICQKQEERLRKAQEEDEDYEAPTPNVCMCENPDECHCPPEEVDNSTKIMWVCTSPSELPSPDDFKGHTTLFICDDMVTQSKKDQQPIEEYWSYVRKVGMSCIYLSQSFFKTPIFIRENSSLLFIKTILSVTNLKRLLKEFSLSEDPKKIIAVYEDLLAKHPTSFLTIDKANPNLDLRFRINFSPIKNELLK